MLSSVGTAEVDALLPSLAEVSQRLGLALHALDPSATAEVKVTAYVTHLLQLAVKQSASDIHLVPQHDSVIVRVRIDGVLQNSARCPKRLTRQSSGS